MTWYPATVTVEPTGEPITIEQARRQVRLVDTDTSFDAELTDYIAAARAHIEKYTGTPLVARTIAVQADGFEDLAHLPVAPIQSITSIGYVDADGADQTVDASVYAFHADGLEPSIDLKSGNQWPAAQAGSRITLTAVVGYDTIPDDVIHAVKLLVAQFFDGHEITPAQGWTWLDSLLCNHRVGS